MTGIVLYENRSVKDASAFFASSTCPVSWLVAGVLKILASGVLLSHGGVSPYRIGTAKDLLAAKEWRQECMAPTGARMDITDWRYNHLL